MQCLCDCKRPKERPLKTAFGLTRSNCLTFYWQQILIILFPQCWWGQLVTTVSSRWVTEAAALLPSSLCWPGGCWLATLKQPGEQRSLCPSACWPLPHKFMDSWQRAVDRSFFHQTGRDFSPNKPMIGLIKTPQLLVFFPRQKLRHHFSGGSPSAA